MSLIRRIGIACVLAVLAGGMARAAPVPFDLNLNTPEVVLDTKRPPACTIAWLVTDTSANDMFAIRMQITPLPDATPVNGHMACPSAVAPRVADRALTGCADRSADPKSCVYADMSREFMQSRSVAASSENASRCRSDQANYIGFACLNIDGVDVCSVGCGATGQAAEAAAQARCLAKQQRACTMGATLPVLAP
jgi:hypothetical protein